MNQGSADRRSRVRLINPIDGAGIVTTALTAGCVLAALVIAACSGGGGAGVPSAQNLPQGSQLRTTPPICTGGGGDLAQPLARGTPCPHPTPWDVIVANPGNNSITSYVIGATGNATPLAVLQGSNTKLSGNYGLYYDGDVNIFAVNSVTNTVNRFSASNLNSGAGGNVAPDQQLVSSYLNKPFAASENYSQNWNGDDVEYIVNQPTTPATPSVTVFQENAAGSAPLYYSISGSNTGLGGQGIAIDNDSASPNFGGIYVDNPTTHKILMFLPSSQIPNPVPGTNYNISPYKTITGSSITNPIGLYVDQNGYLFVVNNNPAKVLVYSPSASGNATPTNTITASLSSPYGVSVYTDLRVFVTNPGNNSVTVYNHGEVGPSSLVQNIIGASTGLNSPASIDVKITR